MDVLPYARCSACKMDCEGLHAALVRHSHLLYSHSGLKPGSTTAFRQVQRYLEAYAASDGGALPAAELRCSQELYAAATAAVGEGAGSEQHVSR